MTSMTSNKKLNILISKLSQERASKVVDLDDKILGWRNCHPDLNIKKLPGKINGCLSLARKNKKGIFIQGVLINPGNPIHPLVYFSRNKDFFSIKINLKANPPKKFNVIAFVQRGGHGPRQGAALDVLEEKGLKTAIFTPQVDNFVTKASMFNAKYLDEVGYTTNLRKNKQRKIQPSLPTDSNDEHFLLSLMALVLANWDFFMSICNADFVVIDSKAEIGTLACAVKNGVNKNLKIALLAYTVFEDLTKIPKKDIQEKKVLGQLLKVAGLGDFGIPDGLEFMMEKVNSIRNKPDSNIVFMTMNNEAEVQERAEEMGFRNVEIIPQISEPIKNIKQTINLNSKEKIHLLRLNSSVYAQAPELLSLFISLARKRPNDKFNLIAKEDQLEIMLPPDMPSNFKYLGWSGTNKRLTGQIINSHTLWVHGGNRPSVIEALHASGKGVIPFFFTQDKITEKVAKYWSTKKFSTQKLLALMMAIETEHERWEIFKSIIKRKKLLERFVVNPLKYNINEILSVLNKIDDLRPRVVHILQEIEIEDTDFLAGVYMKLMKSD